MKLRLLAIAFCLLAASVAAQENFDTVRIVTVKVAGNIYMLKGAGGNIGVLTGPDGVLMIDNQFAPLAPKIKEAIAMLDKGDIRFLINTHIHGDHSGGNVNFRKYGVSIIAHDQVLQRMKNPTTDPKTKEVEPARDKEAWPMLTFADRISLHVNDEDVDVYHFGAAHTDGDVVIHFKKANVFHTGDVFVRYGFPYVDMNYGGSVNGMITYLDKLLAVMNDQAKVIPGHGELATKNDIKTFRNRLADMRDQIVAALKKGKKPGDIPALGITDKYEADWGQGFLKGKDFVLMWAENLQAHPR